MSLIYFLLFSNTWLQTINNVDQSKVDSTVLAFSSTSFNDLLKDFSQTSKTKVAIGYVLMVGHKSVSR